MSFEVYKLIHFIGIFAMVTGLVASSAQAIQTNDDGECTNKWKYRTIHGMAMFLILLGGFGMLARKGVLGSEFPNWVVLKLGIWLTLGLAITLAHRRRAARIVMIGVPALVVLAAAIVLYQPI